MKLQVLPLSQEAFSAYGDVIETQQRDFFHINNGLVERYHDLALVEILEQDRTLISINRAQPANLPLTIHELERHPLGTQAFIPMKGEVFVVSGVRATTNQTCQRCGRLSPTANRGGITIVTSGITHFSPGSASPIF